MSWHTLCGSPSCMLMSWHWPAYMLSDCTHCSKLQLSQAYHNLWPHCMLLFLALNTVELQVKIRGETLQLRNAWRRVTQRLPGDRANAASADNSESASPSRSGNADVATQPDADMSTPTKQKAGHLEAQAHSALRARSSQATATVSITAGHPAGDGVLGEASVAVAHEVEQPLKCLEPAQQLITDVAEPEPDTPEPAHKRARSAATTSQTPSPAADGPASSPDTAVAATAAVGDGAAACDATLLRPCDTIVTADAHAVTVMVIANNSPPALQQGNTVVVTSGGRPHGAASPACDAACPHTTSAEPRLAELTCVTPTQIKLAEAALTTVTPSTVKVTVAKPAKAKPQRAGGRRKGRAGQSSAELKQPATPAAGPAQKGKRKRQQ